jgi:hypothetical protein
MTDGSSSAMTDFTPMSDYDRLVLFRQLSAGFIIGMFFAIRASNQQLNLLFLLGCAICVLSVVPALLWARRMPYNYPFFEIFLATNLTSYGLPLIWEPKEGELFAAETRVSAALAVIMFQAVAMGTFYGLKIRPRGSQFWQRPLFEKASPKWIHAGLVATTVYVITTTYFWYPSSEVIGLLRASSTGVATACTFMLCFLWGQQVLRPGDKAMVVLTVGTLFAVWSTSLVLRQGASLVLLGLAGYFFGRRRVPWAATIACFAVFAVLNLGKYEMREQYWFGDERRSVKLEDLGQFYSVWFDAGINPQTPTQTVSRSGTLVERTSLLHMLCLVAALSPDPVPFLNGETYWHTLGQFVPRYFWPDKPRGHLSTYTLSIHYGLQTEEATQSTTIAFGFLPEAFANFGTIGPLLLGALFGIVFKVLATYSRESPLLSYGGIVIVMITAWSYQTELTMSVWITSLFQAIAATLGVVWAPRKFHQLDSR